ncbi:MAG: fibronectin type III domain-containing protein [Ignavibacteria bacterium]|nr:fibronectin type III domain-containing protein [Ignavibacteria bacterium]
MYCAYTDGSQRNWDYSNDAGGTWTHNRPLISGTYTTVQDMVVDPSSQFSGLSQNVLAAMNNKGVYRSTDAASTWSQVFFSSTANVRSLALNPNNAQNVYAAANAGALGVWKNNNYGASGSWVSVRGGAHKKVAMCPGVGSANTYIAAIPDDGSKLYYSPDAGSTWFDVTGNLPTPINNVFGEGSTTGTMYVATDKGSFKIAEPAASPSSPTVTNGTKFDVSLSWGSVSTATAYHLQISYNSGFTNLLSDLSAVTGTSYSPTNLINNTTYYWRVAANNVAGETDFATGSSFTISASQTMTLTITTDANKHPVLSWTSDPTSSALYKICRYSCVYPGGDCNPHPESTPYPVIATVTASPYTDVDVIVAGKGDPPPNTE